MRNFRLSLSWCLFTTILFSCRTVYQPVSAQYKDYKIANKQTVDNELTALIKPYADNVNRQMSDVVAIAGMDLEKKQPEGTLNNVLADAMLAGAIKKFETTVDAAFLNYGGIRLQAIPKGNVTRGKIFELSPFDNLVVLLKVDSVTLQQFLDIIAKRGGWPCAGIQFQIKKSRAVNVLINGKPFASNTPYTIATIDYVANGGDDCDMFKVIPQQNKNYLFRDAVIEYFSEIQQLGKTISSSIQKRVSNAE